MKGNFGYRPNMKLNEMNFDAKNPASSSMDGLRILLVLGYLPRAAGPTTVVLAEAAEFARAGCEPWVLATSSRRLPAAEDLVHPGTRQVLIDVSPCFGFYFRLGMKSMVDSVVRDMDIVHCQSLWASTSRYACAAAQRRSIPYVISPHGSCNAAAMAKKAWKKRLAMWAYQREDFERSACVHALTAAELDACRRAGIRVPIALIPNGVDLNDSEPADREGFESRFPQFRDRRLCLSMSRLHPVKGLAPLIEAWASLRHRYEDWHLVLAGPDSGEGDALRRLVEQLKLEQDVTFTGNLTGSLKKAALECASALVLPSFSEGFSMAVLEAMANRLPVLMTRACHFSEAAEVGAAIEVETGKAGVTEGLERLLEMTPDALAAMGRTGRDLVERKYTWEAVCSSVLELYGWVLHGGEPPAFVEFAT